MYKARAVYNIPMSEKSNTISDDLEIISELGALHTAKEKVWLWQNSGERKVHFALIRKVDQLRKLVYLYPTTEKGFEVVSKENVFLYSADRLIATKLEIREIDKDYIIFSIPKKIMRVTNSFVPGLEFVEKENEGAHFHERTHERSEIQGEKFISVRFMGQTRTTMFFLNDISQSGLSFKVEDPGAFHKGDQVEIVEMNTKPVEPILKAEVMSVRKTSDTLEDYKVGVKFI